MRPSETDPVLTKKLKASRNPIDGTRTSGLDLRSRRTAVSILISRYLAQSFIVSGLLSLMAGG